MNRAMKNAPRTAPVPASKRWPELQQKADALADEICGRINRMAPHIELAEPTPYKAQCILEMLIENLQRRV